MDCIKATASAALYPWRQFWRLHQIYLDKTVLHARCRWLVTAALASIFALRVFYFRGFYAVSIFLFMYKMCLLMSFITPFVDRGIPSLPIKGSDEFQPFIGRRSEFQLWYAMTKAYTLSITMTFFSICDDVAVILPFLLWFWICFTLVFIIMNTGFMIKYRYLPFTIGKQGIRW